MKASIYYSANFLFFLDSEREIIGYQLDKSTLDKCKYEIVFPKEPPYGTVYTLLLSNLPAKVTYEKKDISDEKATVIEYEINDTKFYIKNTVEQNKDKAIHLHPERGDYCPGYSPLTGTPASKIYNCDYCINEVHCKGSANTPF